MVFDVDGTLVDSMTHFGEIASEVIHLHYGKTKLWGGQAYRDTSGLPFPFQLEKLFPGDSRNVVAAKEFQTSKESSYHEAPFYSDMEETLVALKKRGYWIATSSNNEQDLVLKKFARRTSLFDLILGFRPNFSKGADHFQTIAKLFGVTPSDMLFVGDSLHDAKMAHENNISFVGKLGTFQRSDFVAQGFTSVAIEHLSELTKILIHDSTSQHSQTDRDFGRGHRHSVGR